MKRILLEVANGVAPPKHEPKEHKAMRAKLTEEVEAIKRAGQMVEIPFD